jgi:hypothetical protein
MQVIMAEAVEVFCLVGFPGENAKFCTVESLSCSRRDEHSHQPPLLIN